jgi:signal transduction histidine kinase
MTAVELLSLITRLTFLLVAALTLVDFLRHRDTIRLDIFLIFGAFVPSLVNQLLNQFFDLQLAWLSTVGALGVMAHPYLAVRLLGYFRPVRPALHYAAVVGLLLSWLALLLSPAPRPAPVTLLLVGYFVLFEAYVAYGFVRQALNSGGITRRRLTLVTIATALIAVVILLAAVRLTLPSLDEFIAGLSQVLTMGAGVSYYFGFTPPRWLRRSWQLSELYDYLRQAPGPGRDSPDQEVLAYLARKAVRVVGGLGAIVAVWQQQPERLHIRVTAGFDGLTGTDGGESIVPEGPIWQVWLSGEPLVVVRTAQFGPLEQALAGQIRANAMLLVPIRSSERAWGVLAVFLHHRPVFSRDDLALLGLLGEQSAVTLDYVSLLAAEHHLIERLHHNNAHLQAATKELEAFAYSVSHDLRAPLRGIDGFSDLLLTDYSQELDERAVQYLQRIRLAAQRMGQLIEDLLKLSRVTRSELRTEEVDLTAMAWEIVRDLQATEEEFRARVTIEDNLCVKGDLRLLRIALENLLHNAYKFSSTRAQPEIAFGAFPAENNATGFFVRDNGVGFDMAYADKLFGAFQRLHAFEEFPGTGVGLATVQRIVRRHGGRIWADSAVDQGTTFYFTLLQPDHQTVIDAWVSEQLSAPGL